MKTLRFFAKTSSCLLLVGLITGCQQETKSLSKRDTVLVEQHGLVLTGGMIEDMIYVGEAMADVRFSAPHRIAIAKLQREAFTRDPQKVLAYMARYGAEAYELKHQLSESDFQSYAQTLYAQLLSETVQAFANFPVREGDPLDPANKQVGVREQLSEYTLTHAEAGYMRGIVLSLRPPSNDELQGHLSAIEVQSGANNNLWLAEEGAQAEYRMVYTDTGRPVQRLYVNGREVIRSSGQ